MADDDGRMRGSEEFVRSRIFPYDLSHDVTPGLRELVSSGRIVWYEVDGERLIEVLRFRDHQRIDKPSKSLLSPSVRGSIVEPSENVLGGKGREGSGREGSGMEGKGSFSLRESSTTGPPAQEGPPDQATPHPQAPEPLISPRRAPPGPVSVASAPQLELVQPPPLPDEAPKPKQSRKPDPLHAPLVKSLTAFAQTKDRGWKFTPRAARDVAALLELGSPEEVLERWKRAWSRTTFPLVRQLHELVANWGHFGERSGTTARRINESNWDGVEEDHF